MTKAKGSWKCAKTSLTDQTNKKMTLQGVVEAASGTNTFESFVQNNLQQKGVKLTEEEEKMIQEAIERTLKETRDCEDSNDSSDDEKYEEESDVFT